MKLSALAGAFRSFPQVLVNVPAAYALAKLRFRGRTTLFGAVLERFYGGEADALTLALLDAGAPAQGP